jgi:hypothetical protein
MSLPLKHWTVSVEERTELIDVDLAARLAPFGKSRSQRIRFLYDLFFAIKSTPWTLDAVMRAVQATSGMSLSHEVIDFPALRFDAGKRGLEPDAEHQGETSPLKNESGELDLFSWMVPRLERRFENYRLATIGMLRLRRKAQEKFMELARSAAWTH